VQRDGLARVLDYFRNCRTMDRHRAFAQTFGQSIPQFEAEILARLGRLGQ
jgi:hypothetical protein